MKHWNAIQKSGIVCHKILRIGENGGKQNK